MSEIEQTATDVVEVIDNLGGGVMRQQVQAALSEIARNVVNFGNGKTTGKLSIEFSLRAYGKDQAQMEITAVVKTSQPSRYGKKSEEVGSEQIYWIGRGGKLTINQPKEDHKGQFSLQVQRDGVS